MDAAILHQKQQLHWVLNVLPGELSVGASTVMQPLALNDHVNSRTNYIRNYIVQYEIQPLAQNTHVKNRTNYFHNSYELYLFLCQSLWISKSVKYRA